MYFKLNKKLLQNKILGCLIGKNIGGTIGGPFEGTAEMLDIHGFSSPKGEPLPNDDLDLQIAWLATLERVGAKAMTANDIADSWLMMVAPHFNEYGIGKKNLALGLLPPMSGEYDNALWKNSNGAWIRSEIWACLAPGFPNISIKYAIMDASIDHGLGEGTVAAIFTAAMESIAFVESDIRKIVETALTFIPQTSRVAQCVQLVLDEYDKKTPYRDTRNKVLEITKDLGLFQAPNNIGFVTIGLIYGEGDFKKSILYSTNCGDDTDCTAGTVGALLGIVCGEDGIPQDWKAYIGNSIKQICINPSYLSLVPKTCEDFTERILKCVPEVLAANRVNAELTDGETVYCQEEAWRVLGDYAAQYFKRKPYSFDVHLPGCLVARVEFDAEPIVKPEEEIHFCIKFKQFSHHAPIQGDVSVNLPDGWSAKYRRALHISRPRDLLEQSSNYIIHDVYSVLDVTVVPNENISAANRIWVTIDLNTRSMPLCIPVTVLG